jgi:hypothetical protein
VQILTEGGEPIAQDAEVAPVQNFLHSMFYNMAIELNQKPITSQSGMYHYRAMVENTLNYGNDVKQSRLISSCYFEDTEDFGATADNDGYVARRDLARSGIFELQGDLHADLFNVSKYLLSGVQMNIKLYRSRPEFCLMTSNAVNVGFKIKIHDAILYIRKVRICEAVQLAHEATLSKYPISRVELKSVTLNRNLKSHIVDNIILGQIPKRVIIFFVDSVAFSGSFKTNPMEFKHHNYTHLALHTDTNQTITPLKADFRKNLYMQPYSSLFYGTGSQFSQNACGIAYDEYKRGLCFSVFDLTPDLSAGESHLSPAHSGNLRLEVQFENELDANVNAVLYCEFDNIIEISGSREVFTDYST